MILPVAVVVVALLVVVAGGDLRRLGDLSIRGTVWVVAALAVQLLITVGQVPPTLGSALHLASYALAGVFVVLNRRVPGLPLMATGGAMNLAAIGANGGVMPASPGALAQAGLAGADGHFVNSGAVDGARLWWLGDVFAIPQPLPLANVFSAGDVVLLIGMGVLLVRTCHGDPTPTEPDAGGRGQPQKEAIASTSSTMAHRSTRRPSRT